MRVAERDIDTAFGRFRLIGYRDALSQLPHFALVRGVIDDGMPVLARVHVCDTLAVALQLARADHGARRLIVLGTKRRFSGLSGFGLEVVGYEAAD